jgi:5-methylcytosine-specific restriction endonuclease McrBC regulatory subunit McrC
MRQTDIQDTYQLLARQYYVGPRSYYIPALTAARLILGRAGVAFLGPNAYESEPLTININTLFEEYVRRLLAAVFQPEGVIVEKNTRTAPALFLDGSSELIPDIIIKQHARTLCILDVKYKPRDRVESSDYYQMAAYLRGFATDRGMIVRPAVANTPSNRMRRFADSGHVLLEVHLPLSHWKDSEEYLIFTVRRALAA